MDIIFLITCAFNASVLVMRASLLHVSSRWPGISTYLKRSQRPCFVVDARRVTGHAHQGDTNLPELVQVGVIGGTHGVRGEVRVRSTSDFPEERLEKPGRRWIQPSTKGLIAPAISKTREVESMGGRPHIYKGHSLWIVKFKGIDNPEQAALLNGSQLMFAAEDREELPEDEYYIQQLVGLEVIQKDEKKEVIGRVDSVYLGNDAPDILIIQRHQNKKASPVLLPFVKAFVPVVDLEKGRLLVTPPEGLLELNEAKHLPQSKKEKRQQR